MRCNIKTKICSKCKIRKPIKEFTKSLSNKDRHRCWCKQCVSEYNSKYRKSNKNEIREYRVKYYQKNKKRIIEKEIKYYHNNKKNIVKRAAKYRNNNKDKISKYRKNKALYKTYAHQIEWAENISKGLHGELLVLCTYCGKLHSPTNAAVVERIAALNGKTKGECRLYCCEQCKQACPSYNQHIYWKPQKRATSREVSAQFRQLVLARDCWACQRCGAGAEAELHVHHIEGAVQYPEMSNDLENGITLCKECHKKVHQQKGCKYLELRCFK